MRRLIMLFCASAVAAFAAGCGGDSYEIAEGDLSGKVGGDAWTFASGWTDDFLSDEKGFFTLLYDVDAEACGFGPDSDHTILLDVPRTPGEYELGLTQNVTLATGTDNKVATTGRLVVESVTDTEVEVGLYAIFGDDENNEVSGHFTATVCPPDSP